MAAGEVNGIKAEERLGALTPLTCPECGGSLWEIDDGPVLRHRCHAGQAYDGHLLLAERSELVERALWSALRAPEDRAALLRRHAERARPRGGPGGRPLRPAGNRARRARPHSIRQFLMRDSARV